MSSKYLIKFHNKINLIVLISIFFSLVIFSSFSVFASDSTILEGDTFSVRDGGTINIFDYSLKFVLDANGENIYVDDSNSNYYAIIPLDSCRDIDLIEICFDRSSGTTIYATIFTKIPFLSFETNLAYDETFVGKYNELNITITNEGRIGSESNSLSFDIPDVILVEEYNIGEIVDNRFVWEGKLAPDEEVLITLRLLHLNESESNMNFELVYDNYIMEESLYLTENFEVNDAFYLGIETNYDQLFLGTPFEVSINLSNIYDYFNQRNITFNRLAIPLSSLPELSSPQGFVAETTSNLFWSGRIPYSNGRIFSFSLNPKSSGKLEIPLQLSFNDTSLTTSRTRTLNYKMLFEILSRELSLNISFSGSSFESSNYHKYNISLINLDNSITFENLNVSYYAQGNQGSYNIESLSPNEEYIIENIDFLALPTSERIQDEIKVHVTYENNFGENKEISMVKNFDVIPFNEIELFNVIEEIELNSYVLNTYIRNLASISIEDIQIKHRLPNNIFYTGWLNGSLDNLEPGVEELISSYKFSSTNLNFSANDYFFDIDYSYTVFDASKKGELSFNLTGLVLNLYDDPSVFQITQETIERYFTSTTVFGIFIVAIFLVVASITTVALNKQKFTIGGYDSLERRQHSLEKKKEHYKHKEDDLNAQKQKLVTKINELKDFMSKTKRLMEREVPVIEEKKDGLKTRQEELLEEKRIIDQKILELQEIERRLLKRNFMYQKELKELEAKEKKLNRRFELVKSKLEIFNREMERLLGKENKISKEKEEINKKELGLVAEKQRIIKMGTDKFSSEKIDVIQEKIQLQHEKNLIAEELSSLGNRKQDIADAQQAIHKQKTDLQKEKNIFDMNKEAVESSLQVLQSQSDKIKDILDESRESYIDTSITKKKTDDGQNLKDTKTVNKKKKK